MNADTVTPSNSFETKDIILLIIFITFFLCLCNVKYLCNSSLFCNDRYIDDDIRYHTNDKNIIILKNKNTIHNTTENNNTNVIISSFV